MASLRAISGLARSRYPVQYSSIEANGDQKFVNQAFLCQNV